VTPAFILNGDKAQPGERERQAFARMLTSHPQFEGAVINLVTKAGANQIHGDLFEFLRNRDFNARNASALARDSLKRNQFGGVIGGQVRKNKLFFFAGYQGFHRPGVACLQWQADYFGCVVCK
jgi:hypothetical protein